MSAVAYQNENGELKLFPIVDVEYKQAKSLWGGNTCPSEVLPISLNNVPIGKPLGIELDSVGEIVSITELFPEE